MVFLLYRVASQEAVRTRMQALASCGRCPWWAGGRDRRVSVVSSLRPVERRHAGQVPSPWQGCPSAPSSPLPRVRTVALAYRQAQAFLSAAAVRRKGWSEDCKPLLGLPIRPSSLQTTPWLLTPIKNGGLTVQQWFVPTQYCLSPLCHRIAANSTAHANKSLVVAVRGK